MAYKKYLLSASTDGLNLLVAAIGSPGTTIHTVPTGTSSLDEIWLFALNNSSTDQLLFLEWGGTNAKDLICVPVLARRGDQRVAAGRVLRNGLSVAAYASIANTITLAGFVNRITE